MPSDTLHANLASNLQSIPSSAHPGSIVNNSPSLTTKAHRSQPLPSSPALHLNAWQTQGADVRPQTPSAPSKTPCEQRGTSQHRPLQGCRLGQASSCPQTPRGYALHAQTQMCSWVRGHQCHCYRARSCRHHSRVAGGELMKTAAGWRHSLLWPHVRRFR